MRGWTVAAIAAAVLLTGASAAYALDPAVEAQNYGKGLERQAIYLTPAYQAKLRLVSHENGLNALTMQAADPEREFVSDLCWNGNDGCAGDVRLYDWQTNGYGIVQPVLFTARNGATLSGHVWATKAGPARRPGIVITNGSVQADEQLYWYAAQTLAKAGYVVLTFDPQGQGQSDTQGEAPDQQEGTPAQSDGRPFFDGTEDAINFFLSNPSKPYEPVPSCESGTSHAAKQDRRVAAGLDAAYNPFWSLLDANAARHRRPLLRRGGRLVHRAVGPAREGDRGLGQPRQPGPERVHRRLRRRPRGEGLRGRLAAHRAADHQARARHVGGLLHPARAEHLGPGPAGQEHRVARVQQGGRRHRRDHHPRRHALRLQLHPQPGVHGVAARSGRDRLVHHRLVRPLREGRPQRASGGWSRTAGATTPPRAAVDPNGDPNMFSFYYRSRLDIAGFHCEDLRKGCRGMTSNDGEPPNYSYVQIDTTPDGG